MPKQVAKTGGLAARYGAKLNKAVEAHSADETVMGNVDLPANIKGGVAQLTDFYFKESDKPGPFKGEYYGYAAGVVVEPKEFAGRKIEGRRTSLMEWVCDTPDKSRKTLDEHVAWWLNEIRKLGLQTKGLTGADLEAAAAELVNLAPFFEFETWTSDPTPEYPNPRINHKWLGVVTYTPTTEAGGGVDDQTAAAPAASKNGAATSAKSSPKVTALPDDPDELAAIADDGDHAECIKAQEKLTKLAETAGVSEDDINSAANWAAVVGMIASAGSSGEDDLEALGAAADEGDGEAQERLNELAAEKSLDPNEYPTWAELATALGDEGNSAAPDEEWEPKKGEVYFYKPKGGKRATEHEVTAVFAPTKTCNVKNSDSGVAVKAVPWSDLKTDA